MNELYKPMFLPDLFIAALERNGDSPAVHIGEEVLTAAQMRDQVSRYGWFNIFPREIGNVLSMHPSIAGSP